jgi:hypothetical protein
MKKADEALAKQVADEAKEIVPGTYLADSVNAGTEEITQNDLNTPSLRIVQKTTQLEGLEEKVGWFYRKDTNEQVESVDVHLVYVTTKVSENYNKTGTETQKIYFGFYKGTREPFKLYVRGWSLSSHRDFQTEVAMIKSRWHVPMYALSVRLSTVDVSGTMTEGNKPYSTKKLVFTILKDEKGTPDTKITVGEANFLFESIQRFKEVAMIGDQAEETANDQAQNA